MFRIKFQLRWSQEMYSKVSKYWKFQNTEIEYICTQANHSHVHAEAKVLILAGGFNCSLNGFTDPSQNSI